LSSCPTTRLPPCSHLLFRMLTLLDPTAKIKPAPSSKKQVAHPQASSHSPSQMPSFPRCISVSLPRQHPRLSHGAHSHKHLLPFSLPLYSPLCLPDRIHIAEEVLTEEYMKGKTERNPLIFLQPRKQMVWYYSKNIWIVL